jgi:hypothetical protein
VNVAFRVVDEADRPRSHRKGIPVRPGTPEVGHLTLIPGPLALDFSGRLPWKPRLETGEIAGYHRPSTERARLWLRHAPRVGRHVFIKLFTHGAQERNSEPLLGGELDRLFSSLNRACRDLGVSLHYVSAFELWQALEALREERDPLPARARPAPLVGAEADGR